MHPLIVKIMPTQQSNRTLEVLETTKELNEELSPLNLPPINVEQH